MRFLHLFVVSMLFTGVTPATGWPGSARTAFDDALRRSASHAPADTLTFDEVLTRVARTYPAFGVAAARIEAAQNGVTQARARPNPWLHMAAENVGGTYSGFDASELSVLLSQEFELGGKRSARTTAAEAASAAAGLEADLAILDVYLAAKQRFSTAAHADERLRLAHAHESVVAELAAAARDRVRAGAALLADPLLADVALVRVRQEARLAEMERTRARRDLAALWGEPDGVSEPIEALALPERLPEADSIAAWVGGSAAVTRARRATATSEAGLHLERSLRVPTLTAGAGVRRVETDGATTFLFSATLPLPLWDRRDGAIHSAQAQVRAAELEIELARSVTRSQLESGLNRMSAMLERLREANESTLPTLQSASREMETAYRIGRASYADLLEVHRMRIEIENEINDLHLAIVHEVSEIERLAARTIEETMSDE